MTLHELLPYLVPMPILLPALTAALVLFFTRLKRVQRGLTMVSYVLLIILCFTLVYLVDHYGIQTVQIGGWDAPIGITLVADRLSTLMLSVSSLVLFSVMWFAMGQARRDGAEEEPVAIFLPSYLLLSMGVNIAFLAGDLFNLYVGFEVFLVASYVLLTLGASAKRVSAGISYVMVSMVSSMVFLFALGMIYASVGTVNMAQIGERMEQVPSGTRTAMFAVLLIAFGIKAAVFPLYSWLPDSYPTAAALITAVFAGLLTKVGVYSIIRARTVMFTDGSLDTMLMWAALLTMLVGILGAMAQNDIKRLLSFTLVSHIGYMIMGIAIGTPQGLSGAIFYVVHHILVQTALFLVVGLIERQAGSTSLRSLGSLASGSTLLAVLYIVPALNLGGIPPFSGFLGKIILIEAAADSGTGLDWLLVAGAVVTSLLTLYTMMNVWSKAFWRDRKDAPEGSRVEIRPMPLTEVTVHVDLKERKDVGRMPFGMVAPTALLVAASIAVTVLAGPISTITTRSAEAAQDVSRYRTAVLGEQSTENDAAVKPGRTPEMNLQGHDDQLEVPVIETSQGANK